MCKLVALDIMLTSYIIVRGHECTIVSLYSYISDIFPETEGLEAIVNVPDILCTVVSAPGGGGVRPLKIKSYNFSKSGHLR